MHSSGAKLAFSLMYEDPDIEKSVILNSPKEQLNCLFICSAGCTMLSVLSEFENKISHIDTVDINPAQIEYVKGRILGADVVGNLFPTSSYEELFSELRESGLDFEKVFRDENLLSKFGPDAVRYSTRQTFATHFAEVWQKLQKEPENNVFRQRFLSRQDWLPHFRCEKVDKIDFHTSDIIEFLSRFATTTEKYELISLSNVSDWMSTEKVVEMLHLAKKSLAPGGSIVLRRLNSDLSLRQLIAEVEFSFVTDVTKVEKTKFYQEVLVLEKSISGQ